MCEECQEECQECQEGMVEGCTYGQVEGMFVRCSCGEHDHIMVIELLEKQVCMIMSMQMIPQKSFFRRLWSAIKLVFTPNKMCDRWSSCVISDSDQAMAFAEMTEKLVLLMKDKKKNNIGFLENNKKGA